MQKIRGEAMTGGERVILKARGQDLTIAKTTTTMNDQETKQQWAFTRQNLDPI